MKGIEPMNNGTDNTDSFVAIRPNWMDQQTWSRIKNDTETLLVKLDERVHDTAVFSWHDIAEANRTLHAVDRYDRARDDIDPITNKAAKAAALDPSVGALLLWNRTKDLETGELYMLAGQTRAEELQVMDNVSWMISCGTVYAADRVGMKSYKASPDFTTRLDGDTYLGWVIPNDRDVDGMRR
jgi:hypothetical protein